MKLLNESFQRQIIIKDFSKWFNLNIRAFISPFISQNPNIKKTNENEVPVIEEPIIEEPVIEEPVYEEPVIEEPVDEEPVDEEPVIEEPVYEEEVYEEEVITENPTNIEIEVEEIVTPTEPLETQENVTFKNSSEYFIAEDDI
jgi:hypothetical protein